MVLVKLQTTQRSKKSKTEKASALPHILIQKIMQELRPFRELRQGFSVSTLTFDITQ
jgi:hypothetical protein